MSRVRRLTDYLHPRMALIGTWVLGVLLYWKLYYINRVITWNTNLLIQGVKPTDTPKWVAKEFPYEGYSPFTLASLDGLEVTLLWVAAGVLWLLHIRGNIVKPWMNLAWWSFFVLVTATFIWTLSR